MKGENYNLINLAYWFWSNVMTYNSNEFAKF